ncbi:hypothetical protein C0Q70_14440 [Pomacea canaliculata]|uniref:EF-hand domain-containing protein n=1 Tax=Pomacea canaliculata TaxID=400727 RepID=A0A2T7P021_POMCA|nr:hypothetical protein C0Q70_14440 [Pomacea canaliculata]
MRQIQYPGPCSQQAYLTAISRLRTGDTIRHHVCRHKAAQVTTAVKVCTPARKCPGSQQVTQAQSGNKPSILQYVVVFVLHLKAIVECCLWKLSVNKAASLTPEELKDYRQTFDMFDKDRSGGVSLKELGDILKATGLDVSSEQLSRLISKYDTNGDGDIDFEEFTRLITESEVAAAVAGARIFKAIDTDGSGSVSASELRTALDKRGVGLTEGQLQQMISLPMGFEDTRMLSVSVT